MDKANEDAVYYDKFEDLRDKFDDLRAFSRKIDRKWKPSRNLAEEKRNKVIVCHDMKGGYLQEDMSSEFELKVNDPNPFVYAFWWYTDIFIYFSHHFITVPTVRWINEAHDHDVLCLGTFITEFDDGKVKCDEIFGSLINVDELVRHLVDLCLEWHFDGWLINIENEIKPEHIPNVIYFLEQLRNKLKSNIGEHSLLIWYDSITNEGKLAWQNCLNEKNNTFAQRCDGLFTNYTWNRRHLKVTKKFVEENKTQLSTYDIYFGVDVFGRGAFEGGGFNTYKAVQAARNYEFSSAIFAPGWTSECFGPGTFSLVNHYKLFSQMIDIVHPHRVKNDFKTKMTYGFQNGRFNPNHREIQPFLLESDDVKLTENGIEIGGKKDSKHVIYLTDILNVKDYQLSTSNDQLLPKATTETYKEGHSDKCKITEIYVVKATDDPVILTDLDFTVQYDIKKEYLSYDIVP
ncbi:unnamed protein product [Bursaphelenchus okinawaensis]|uniref:Cytosolic endo-beta-N-acetylglucosaminidase TIM barrel domain-containing protein n=1 Tax=Bursaphelenchus okinawaensis TaxID=465554 RepID=A0A811LKD4_9BILA|nr:unnamed protein product [Bursaphelenchus okinawaensis]CAG9124125.1 unnamed protein product [Bursaphelenchus okinawaensis]